MRSTLSFSRSFNFFPLLATMFRVDDAGLDGAGSVYVVLGGV